MDTTRDIIYRGYTLNEESLDITGGGGVGSGISGCKVHSFDLSDVDVVQWTEKRSQADGNDAGDVFLGQRRVRMRGTLYSLSRGAIFDDLSTLRAAFNPVLAQREEPADKGYRPLYFAVPTLRLTDYPTGVIELQVKAMPRAFNQTSEDDAMGGDDEDALATPWQATLVCAKPDILSADPVTVNFTATTNFASTTTCPFATDLWATGAAHGLVAGDRITFSSITGGTLKPTLGTAYYVIASGLTTTAFKVSATLNGSAFDVTGSDITAATWVKSSTATGNWTNRGTYLGKFNMLVEVGAGAGTISAQVGDSVFTVTVPASTGNRIVRVKEDKVTTIEEGGVEPLAMGSIVFSTDTTYPLIDPGETPYTITFHGMSGVVTGSRMWFYEQYA